MCGRTVLDLVVEPPRFPQVGGVCKESGDKTVVHSVYSSPHALMHDSNVDNQAAPAEWEGNLEDIRTWDTIPLGVNYPSVQGRLKQNTEFWESELLACSFVRNIIEVGYRLPLFREPPPVFFKNHASARQEEKFVENALLSLLGQSVLSQPNDSQ